MLVLDYTFRDDASVCDVCCIKYTNDSLLYGEDVVMKAICDLFMVYLRMLWHSYSIISVTALNILTL